MARIIVSSSTSRAPASSMTTPSRVPDTTRSRSPLAFSSIVGLSVNSPSSSPTRTAPTGPSNGMPEIISAADAAMVPITSVSAVPSCESTVRMIWTSLRMPFGKSGRSGRSVSREARMPVSGGRPSRRNTLPGILPME